MGCCREPLAKIPTPLASVLEEITAIQTADEACRCHLESEGKGSEPTSLAPSPIRLVVGAMPVAAVVNARSELIEAPVRVSAPDFSGALHRGFRRDSAARAPPVVF